MDIRLPKRTDGNDPVTLHNINQITVIGANGAGKTRFALRLLEDAGEKAYKISALKAIFPSTSKNESEGSIDLLYDKAAATSHFLKSDAETEIEKVIFLLLHDEFIQLLRYKSQLISNPNVKPPVTKLDTVAKVWEAVFPKNKILRQSGKILFSSGSGDDQYSAIRLSDGEKAVLYYIAAILYAMPDAVIYVDNPGVFIHPSMMTTLWNVLEQMRPDCTFIYGTHDVDFASSRLDCKCIWVKSYDAFHKSWDYEIVGSQHLSEELYIDLLGSRKPVLFIEGDETHSIDSKLYPLVFTEYTIKPLGSCNKVIESTRTFNDLANFHHLDSYGIVDRDRRDEKEVSYLRDKKILVPNVAEIENILMLPDVIKTVAKYRKKNPDIVFAKVRKSVISMFSRDIHKQAMQHVRHRVKRSVEYKIDKRFTNITALESHMIDLVNEINPRGTYEYLLKEFRSYADRSEYENILKVYNEKTMLPESNVAQLCGLNDKGQYLHTLLKILKENGEDAKIIRKTIKKCFGLATDN